MKNFKNVMLLLLVVLTIASCTKENNDREITSSFEWVDGNNFTHDVTIGASNVFPIYIKNTTNDSLTLNVEVLENTIPAMWMGMVCIYETCFNELPPVGTNKEMFSFINSEGYVRLTVNPMGIGSGGALRLKVYDVNKPSDSKTCSWTVTAVE